MSLPASTSLQRYVRSVLPYALSVILFYVFRTIVEDPWISRDSWDYINCAIRGDEVWYRPLGYTNYLKFIHSYDGGYGAAIFLQFFIFVAAASLFLERIFKLFDFQFRTKILVWCFTIYNPFIFYLSNFLTTDTLFAGLTCLWMVSLINSFLVDDKRAYGWLFVHCCTYYFLLALRFNALYYPAMSLLAVLMYKGPFVRKMVIAALPIFVVLSLVKNAQNHAVIHTGSPEYSGLGSWAIANNALHIYKVREVDANNWDDVDEMVLHENIMMAKDTIKYPAGEVTDQYMWHPYGPLKQYVFKKTLYMRPRTRYYTEWFAAAPLYRKFGLKLIKRYPMAFLQSFYLPNLRNCFFPKMEILDFKKETVPVLDAKAIAYIKAKKETYVYSEWQKNSIDVMRYAFFVLNILIALAIPFAIFIGNKNRKRNTPAITTLLLLCYFHLASIFLLAFAHPAWIRYMAFNELFMILVPICVAGMLKDKNRYMINAIEGKKIAVDKVLRVPNETENKDKGHKPKKAKSVK